MIVLDGWAMLWNLLAAVGALLVVFIGIIVTVATDQARWVFIIPGGALAVLLIIALVAL